MYVHKLLEQANLFNCNSRLMLSFFVAIPLADQGGARQPLGPISLIFMQFSAKILDPALVTSSEVNCGFSVWL